MIKDEAQLRKTRKSRALSVEELLPSNRAQEEWMAGEILVISKVASLNWRGWELLGQSRSNEAGRIRSHYEGERP